MNIVEQAKERVKREIIHAVLQAGLAGQEDIPEFVLEIPKEKAHGDYATNIAMQLSRIARKSPRDIAGAITSHFDAKTAGVSKMEVAGPGFINFFMDNAYLSGVIRQVLDAGANYGRTDTGRNKKIQVEFVSANPTGDLHLGHARGAAVGDTLSNMLEMAGYEVTREYYINDAGNQIHNLALSIDARYRQALGKDAQMPEDGYYGQDIIQIARDLAETDGDHYLQLDESERLEKFRRHGLAKELAKIKQDLADYRVAFDVWFSETSLYESGEVERIVGVLREKGYVYEQDGAIWFRSTAFGDDKDRVLVKNDGSYTYLTPDVAYHLNKYQRGFDQVINIWGADHHGYIPRMKAAIQALGYRADQLTVLINQMVNLYQGGEKVKMSKRTGKAVTLRELMEEVGVDATRYFFSMRSPDAHLDFDMDLAVSKSNENPVFYVQYAHARICSILRQANESGVEYREDQADWDKLSSEKEIDLLKKLGEFPYEIVGAAEQMAVHRVVRYIYELSSLFHSFYNAERVLTEDSGLTQARLGLVQAVQIVLRNGFGMIGISAPERM